jgi:hypothetical protein
MTLSRRLPEACHSTPPAGGGCSATPASIDDGAFLADRLAGRYLATSPGGAGAATIENVRYRREIEVARDPQNVFDYVVTEYEEGRRIALHGEGAKARSDDVITVNGADGRARVGYEADIRLKGVYRIAEPFLRSTFRQMGDDVLGRAE